MGDVHERRTVQVRLTPGQPLTTTPTAHRRLSFVPSATGQHTTTTDCCTGRLLLVPPFT